MNPKKTLHKFICCHCHQKLPISQQKRIKEFFKLADHPELLMYCIPCFHCRQAINVSYNKSTQEFILQANSPSP